MNVIIQNDTKIALSSKERYSTLLNSSKTKKSQLGFQLKKDNFFIYSKIAKINSTHTEVNGKLNRQQYYYKDKFSY